MTTLPKKSAKTRPLLLCALAATILGRLRATGSPHLSTRDLALAFPAFNPLEMAHALHELIDKHLLTQKGTAANATYSLTEQGRVARIAVD